MGLYYFFGNEVFSLFRSRIFFGFVCYFSVFIDTPHGLLVPNIKDCQARSILEIASELNRLHQAGLENKLRPDDLSGGTFSLSNIGAIGGK